MNNPKFYIYGVPDGFNILSGTPEEILYYQLFYDTSKKGREMRINRKSNGETVYSYLIYNLVACKGREGAFLGMSIAFNGNEYCNNPVALKELFEGVYNEVILKADDKDKIIAALDGGYAVGRFCITKFDERQEMCEKIGRIIINNVIGELASSIRTIDNSFDNSKEGRILTLPLDADNNNVSQALRNYTWVSLSSECKITPIPSQPVDPHRPSSREPTAVAINQDLLSVHFINELSKKVGSYKDFIIQGLKGLVSLSEISTKREEINHHLDTIEEYAGRQPVLTKLKEDYMSIYKELVDLKPRKPTVPPLPEPQPSPHNDDENGGIMTLIRPYLSRRIAALCAIFVIAIAVILWPSDNPKPTSSSAENVEEIAEEQESGTDYLSTKFNEKKFQALLAGADYKAAWSMLQKVVDEEKRKSLELALQNSYREWFNSELNERQNDLGGLIELKKKIAAYADFNEDNNRHNELLDAYINPLQEQIEKEKLEQQRQLAQQESEQQKKKSGRTLQEGSGRQGGSATEPSRRSVIKIFKADRDYNKREQISASSNVIQCKRNDYFVVEGATLSKKDRNIEVVPIDGIIRIRVPNVGQFKVKLNQVEYTFQVTM